MVRTHWLVIAALALTLASCKSTGCGSREAALHEPATVAAAVEEVRAVALPFELAARLPGDADAYAVADVAYLAARSAAVTPGVGTAEVLWSKLMPQVEVLTSSPEFPEALRAGIHPDRVRSVAAAAWSGAEGAEPSWVVLTDPEFLEAPPQDGGPAVPIDDGISMAVRDGVLVLGGGPKFAAVVAGDAGTGFTGAQSWPDGWGRVPTDAGVVVYMPRPSEDFPDSWKTAGLSRVLFATAPGAASVVAVDIQDDAILRNFLGGAQSAIERNLTQWRALAPPFAQGWVAYADLSNRALWSQVSLERAGTMSVVRVAAPRCGTGTGAVYAIAAAAWLGTADRGAGATPFQPVTERIAEDCEPIPGPPPALPVRFTAMAGADATGSKVLVLADVGGLLRQNLTTFFHLLPFALHPDDVVQALGPTPLGMAGLSDPNGFVAAFMDLDSGADATAVLPPGAHGYLPIPVPPVLGSEVIDGVGWVIGPAERARSATQPPPAGSPWARIVDALPDGSVLAAVGTRATIAPLLAEVPADARILSDASLIAAAVDADLGATFAFFVGSDAAAVAEATSADLDRMVESGTSDLDEFEARMVRTMFGPVRDAIVIETSGEDVVLLRLGTSSAQGRSFLIGGLVAALVIPQIVDPMGPLGGILDATQGTQAVPATPGLGGKPPRQPTKPPR